MAIETICIPMANHKEWRSREPLLSRASWILDSSTQMQPMNTSSVCWPSKQWSGDTKCGRADKNHTSCWKFPVVPRSNKSLSDLQGANPSLPQLHCPANETTWYMWGILWLCFLSPFCLLGDPSSVGVFISLLKSFFRMWPLRCLLEFEFGSYQLWDNMTNGI